MNANLKMAIRGIFKNKVQSAISIFGLGIGLGCIMLLALLYIHENSFDRYIPDHQSLYRVIQGNDCQTSLKPPRLKISSGITRPPKSN
jgi:putative ABC transport system permease protein